MSALTLQQLRVLAAVVEHRSFTRGAQAVHMTQSAASQHVRSLEQALRTPLVERVSGDLLPTRAGAGLLEYAREMLRLAADAEHHVAALRDGAAGRLSLCAAGSAVYLVPGLLAAFREAHSGVGVALEVASRDALYDAVAGGQVDAGLVSGPVEDHRLVAHPLCPDRLVLVASPASPLLAPASLAPLPLDCLTAQALIAAPAVSQAWRQLANTASDHGVALRPLLRLDQPEAIKKAVEAGLGVAFLSAWAVEREVALGTLRILPTALPPLDRELTLVHSAARRSDALLGTLIRFAPEYLGRRLPPPVAERVVPEVQLAAVRQVAQVA